jgi:hypothetical protein
MKMASWEPALREAILHITGGREIIEEIDHTKRKIVIDREVKNPDLLKNIQAAVNQVTVDYEVIQLA